MAISNGMNKFEIAFSYVIGVEGGYASDPRDSGGPTKFGISQRAYPNEDIANLTRKRAVELYRRDYWYPIRGDDLPVAVGLCLFDYAVNSGVETAIKAVQRVALVPADGVMGPVTIAALHHLDVQEFVVSFQAERLLFLSRLPSFADFGRGWTRRVIRTAIAACGDLHG